MPNVAHTEVQYNKPALALSDLYQTVVEALRAAPGESVQVTYAGSMKDRAKVLVEPVVKTD